jgi:hypothetical protein
MTGKVWGYTMMKIFAMRACIYTRQVYIYAEILFLAYRRLLCRQKSAVPLGTSTTESPEKTGVSVPGKKDWCGSFATSGADHGSHPQKGLPHTEPFSCTGVGIG